MFKFSPLLIALLVVPSCLSADVPAQTTQTDRAQEMCGETWGIAQKLGSQHRVQQLRGLLIGGGIRIWTEDPRISAAALEESADAWNSTLGGGTVRVAESAVDANVIVESANQLGEEDDQQGEIDVFQQVDGSLVAKVSININSKATMLSPIQQGAVLTHELGHFIGLDDSQGGDNIMGTFDVSHLVTRPSAPEVLAIRELRAGIQRTLMSL